MLSIGGLNPASVNYEAAINDTDPFWEGMKVFDMTDLKWTNYYNATAAPYIAPSAVAAHYAAGSTYPSTWSDEDVKSLFLNPTSNASTPTPTPTQPSSTSRSEPTQPSSSPSRQVGAPRLGTSKRNSHTAATVGGAVGGVAAVALLGLAIYLLTRRQANGRSHKRKGRKLPQTYENRELSEVGPALAHEAYGQALPYEVDSRYFHGVGHDEVHEM